jgi:hypothetical protein
MEYTYIVREENETIMRVDAEGNVSNIPKDLGNSDYQEYLKSLDEASTL